MATIQFDPINVNPEDISYFKQQLEKSEKSNPKAEILRIILFNFLLDNPVHVKKPFALTINYSIALQIADEINADEEIQQIIKETNLIGITRYNPLPNTFQEDSSRTNNS